MPCVYYLPDEREVETNPGETILQVSLRTGIPHTHVCGGNARCSTCRVLILEGVESCAPRNAKEQALAELLTFAPTIRLACQTTVTGSVKLRRLVLDAEDVKLTSQLEPDAKPGPVGEEKKVAILFADIRGFTRFAEALPPYDVVHVLNRYFYQMGQAISRNGGFIDNYMGDGLMAIFVAEDPTGAAMRAIQAGLEMLEAVEGLKPYLEGIYTRSFQIGIGVHYGQVVIGSIGAANTKRVTAIGDAVNLACRIEQANKEHGTTFLISEETHNYVRGQVRVSPCVPLALPGKSGRYALYEVIGMNESNSWGAAPNKAGEFHDSE